MTNDGLTRPAVEPRRNNLTVTMLQARPQSGVPEGL